MRKNNIRHGDIALLQVNKIPDNLKEVKIKTLYVGSGGNAHTFSNGKFYKLDKEDTFIIGYFIAEKGCKLFHKEHGEIIKGRKLRECSIPAGIYELRHQVEDTNEGMKPVVD